MAVMPDLLAPVRAFHAKFPLVEKEASFVPSQCIKPLRKRRSDKTSSAGSTVSSRDEKSEWSVYGTETVPTLFVAPCDKKNVTSRDAECAKYQAFLLFSEYQHNVVECTQPDMSPTGILPFLITPGGNVYTGRAIITEVIEQMGDLESRLTDSDRADVKAFTAATEASLGRAMQWLQWVNPQGYQTFTRPMYEKYFSWPLNHVLPYMKRQEVIASLKARYGVNTKEEIIIDLQQTFASLASKLGKQTYFFGDKACYLDAVSFAYIHTINGQLPEDHEFKQILKGHPSLINYSKNVFNTYLSA